MHTIYYLSSINFACFIQPPLYIILFAAKLGQTIHLIRSSTNQHIRKPILFLIILRLLSSVWTALRQHASVFSIVFWLVGEDGGWSDRITIPWLVSSSEPKRKDHKHDVDIVSLFYTFVMHKSLRRTI